MATTNGAMLEDAKADGGPKMPLTMRQVYELAHAGFEARGFPDIMNGPNARRVCWLEERGLPGFAPFVAELTRPDRGVWNERGLNRDADGQAVFGCPFSANVIVTRFLDDLVQPDPEEIKGIRGPSMPILLLPRLAEHAVKIGAPLAVYFKTGDPPRFGARVATDGDRVLLQGIEDGVRAVFEGSGISLSRLKGGMPKEARGAFRDRIEVPRVVVQRLAEFIAREETDARAA